uniref:Uncharacterized protein n=1 Tax=Phytophthora ramorum TaxID=164328 RepID=H3H957_PHYRM
MGIHAAVADWLKQLSIRGRRDYHQREVVVIQDEETTDQDSSQSDDDNEEEEEEEAARDEDFGPGNKRHLRTQSLEEVTEVPSAKRGRNADHVQVGDGIQRRSQVEGGVRLGV